MKTWLTTTVAASVNESPATQGRARIDHAFMTGAPSEADGTSIPHAGTRPASSDDQRKPDLVNDRELSEPKPTAFSSPVTTALWLRQNSALGLALLGHQATAS